MPVGGPWSRPSSCARAFQTRPQFPQDRRLVGRAGPAAPSVTCQGVPRPTRIHPARRIWGLAMAGTGPRTGTCSSCAWSCPTLPRRWGHLLGCRRPMPVRGPAARAGRPLVGHIGAAAKPGQAHEPTDSREHLFPRRSCCRSRVSLRVLAEQACLRRSRGYTRCPPTPGRAAGYNQAKGHSGAPALLGRAAGYRPIMVESAGVDDGQATWPVPECAAPGAGGKASASR